jgi:hypothetical protein
MAGQFIKAADGDAVREQRGGDVGGHGWVPVLV